MKRKKIVIKGVSMVSDEDARNRNKRNYNLMDIQREAKVAKGAQWMDADAEAKVAKSAQWTNADELKYPGDFYVVMRLMVWLAPDTAMKPARPQMAPEMAMVRMNTL